MMFREFINEAIRNGLECFGIYYGMYRGFVADNEDPLQIGRLRVRVPQIYRNTVPDKWVNPRGQASGANSGINWLPEIGDPIWITFENGSPRYPVWEYGWWTQDTLPERAKRNPPKSYLFQTPNGNYLELNDDKNYIRMENQAGFIIEINDQGVFVGNDETNLFELFDSVVTAAENTKVSTLMGPQPFINLPEWILLRQQFEQFLVNVRDGD